MKLFSCLMTLLLFLLQAVPGKGQAPRWGLPVQEAQLARVVVQNVLPSSFS